ncbi:MAG: hypothetical protein COW88_02395 [Candidatus Lloydbacteria bacterium CG22_combo_CG10-13_8_21_14_all_47_15]|uniref:Rubrerythrin diiron-binding domain-containing protein n=1 Tax=Candidatus Lloydbacteria bacterium CG22_combo_CG10-13_8_21_14_all_47_15 TaxID=1974635 RepID=A0A2H0CUA1_9BACT|nr:MAG: hypothetical protein COW88_02395 [Candidatus Lloydbacteria bacterium CG22_combo_CG10-13_8_21_14_all_47_15]
MLENHSYNLIEQMAEENKSLWRIKNEYKKDTSGCSECSAFWEKLEKDKETHIADLKVLIKTHL